MTVQDIEPPRLGRQAALDIASAYFGVTGNLTPLASERDQIFKLTTSGGAHFVLRISSPGEAPAVLEFQNEALLKIAADYPALPVPRLRASVNSRLVERLQRDGRSYGVRLFSFLPGAALDGRPLSPALYRNIGGTLATLDRALKGLRRPPANEKFFWNMHLVANLYPLVGHIEEAENRRLVEAIFERLHESAFATLAELRSQVIHNDCNAKNVLVDVSNPDVVSGIIDFGDLTESALIVELGVAIARQVHVERALAAACELIEGYHASLPLEEREVGVLFDVICARLAMKALIWCWRKSLGDSRFPERIGNTFELLALWNNYGPQRSTETFRAACRGVQRKTGTERWRKESR